MSDNTVNVLNFDKDFLIWVINGLKAPTSLFNYIISNIGYTQPMFNITISQMQTTGTEFFLLGDNLESITTAVYDPSKNEIPVSNRISFGELTSVSQTLGGATYKVMPKTSFNVRIGKSLSNLGNNSPIIYLTEQDIGVFTLDSDTVNFIILTSSTTPVMPTVSNPTLKIDQRTIHPLLLNNFLVSDNGKEYLKTTCLNTQGFFNENSKAFAQFNFCKELSTPDNKTTFMLNTNTAFIPSNQCTENVNYFCSNFIDENPDFCGCYTEDIPQVTKGLVEINKNIFPSGLCEPGEITDSSGNSTCIPRICVLPSCMGGKSYKNAKELRYKCPKLCSNVLNIDSGKNSNINYTNSSMNLTCSDNSIYVGDMKQGLNTVKIATPNDKNRNTVIILSVVIPIIIFVTIGIIFLIKK